jgi:hypothetical protein
MTDFPLGALALPLPAAEEAWRDWRSTLDIDALPYENQQLIAALAGRLPAWLEQDASAARLQGIIKMAWSRNQVRLRSVAELRRMLLSRSVELALAAGPPAWSLRTRDEGAIRFIPYLALLVPRRDVAKAVLALAANGWESDDEIPEGDALDWSCHIGLNKGGDRLHLHWRLFPTSPGEAVACERASLERPATAVWKGHTFQVLSAEADLLHRLTDHPHWDPVPWQADVLMTPFDGLDWRWFRALALRFAPDAIGRLMELRRDFQLPVPEILPQRRHPLSRVKAAASVGRASLLRLLRRVSARGGLLWKS